MAPKSKAVTRLAELEKIDVKEPKVGMKEHHGNMMLIRRPESPPVESSLNTLPVELKTKVLQWAAFALREEKHSGTLGAMSSNNWLLNVAASLPDWVVPALNVLYEEPDLESLERAIRFHNSLKAFPSMSVLTKQVIALPVDTTFEYQSKVFKLALDANWLKKRTAGRMDFDLSAFLSLVSRPTLKELTFIDLKDTPIHRRAGIHPAKWIYPYAIFTALDANKQQLSCWNWNGRWLWPSRHRDNRELLRQQCEWMADKHQLPCLASVEHLELFNFHIKGIRSPDISDIEDEGAAREESLTHGESDLAQALHHLKHLKFLVFNTSNMANKTLFSILSLSLQSLTIDNCDHFTSSALRRYLTANGKGLKELSLKHNKAQDLSFLADLGYLCPNLEVLIVDCLYYNTFATSRDSEPNYETLLEPDQELNLPESLQRLEMRHLREWSPDAAQSFFMSLLKAGPTLVNLRTLILNAKLDIRRDENWRERNKVRSSMKEALQKMFQRPFTAPSTDFNSMESFAFWKAAQNKENDSDSDVIAVGGRKRAAAPITNGRTKRRRITMSRDEPSDTETDNDFKTPAKPLRTRELPIRAAARHMKNASSTATRRSTRQKDQQSEKDSRGSVQAEQEEPSGLMPSRSLRPRGSALVPISSASPVKTRSKAVAKRPALEEPKSELEHLLAKLKRKEIPVQGLCDVCDILIDNQRPTDLQFTANDFLDEELEEDDPDFEAGNTRTSDVSDISEVDDGLDGESEAEFTDSEDELS